jgi:hypothetical protein
VLSSVEDASLATTPVSVITTDRQRTGVVQSFGYGAIGSAAPGAAASALAKRAADDVAASGGSPPRHDPAAAVASSSPAAARSPDSYAVRSAAGVPASVSAAADDAEMPASPPSSPQAAAAAAAAAAELHRDPDVEEALRIQSRANRRLANKEYVRAIEEYTAALFLVPDDPILSPNLHLGRAHALNGCRRHERARTDAVMALRLQRSPAAYSTLAKSLFYLRDYAGAIEAFRECAGLLPPGEQLGMFDRAYLAKAEAALEDEEASLRRAGMIRGGEPSPSSSPARPGAQSQQQPRGGGAISGASGAAAGGSSNRSVLSVGTSGSAVPKLPPPRFVPREQALAQAPVVPPMPREWPRQSADAPRDGVRCGPERTVEFLSESLGVKLNRGADGFVRVLWVAREDPSSPYLARRGGPIEVGHVVREAAGVDLRRPITNVMWGDTVALVKMAPRPIALVVAPELSDVPAPVLEEMRRANGGVLPPTVKASSSTSLGAAAAATASPTFAPSAAAAASGS